MVVEDCFRWAAGIGQGLLVFVVGIGGTIVCRASHLVMMVVGGRGDGVRRLELILVGARVLSDANVCAAVRGELRLLI